MKIAKMHSHLNGHEHLLINNPSLWDDVMFLIGKLDLSGCHATGLEERGVDRIFRGSIICDRLRRDLLGRGWSELPASTRVRRQFIRDRTSISLNFGKRSANACDPLAGHIALFLCDTIDVGVTLLPSQELQSRMRPGTACYEAEIDNLLRQGRGTPAVPLVLIGITC